MCDARIRMPVHNRKSLLKMKELVKFFLSLIGFGMIFFSFSSVIVQVDNPDLFLLIFSSFLLKIHYIFFLKDELSNVCDFNAIKQKWISKNKWNWRALSFLVPRNIDEWLMSGDELMVHSHLHNWHITYGFARSYLDSEKTKTVYWFDYLFVCFHPFIECGLFGFDLHRTWSLEATLHKDWDFMFISNLKGFQGKNSVPSR